MRMLLSTATRKTTRRRMTAGMSIPGPIWMMIGRVSRRRRLLATLLLCIRMSIPTPTTCGGSMMYGMPSIVMIMSCCCGGGCCGRIVLCLSLML